MPKKETNPYRMMCVYAGPEQMEEASRRLNRLAAEWDQQHPDAAMGAPEMPDDPAQTKNAEDPADPAQPADTQNPAQPADPQNSANPAQPDVAKQETEKRPSTPRRGYPSNFEDQREAIRQSDRIALVYAGPPIRNSRDDSVRLPDSGWIRQTPDEPAPFCSSCGTKFASETAKFCTECGSPRTRFTTCPSCGAKLTNRPGFCPFCGAKQGN